MGHNRDIRRESRRPPDRRGATAQGDKPREDMYGQRPWGEGVYGSGGSYGYGGGFEHPTEPPGRHPDTSHGFVQDSGYPQSGGYHGERGATPYDSRGGFGSAEGDVGPLPWRTRRGPYFGRSPRGYTRSDARIYEDVCDLLMYGHVDPSDVSVSVEQGEVRLEGFVQSRRDKYEIEELAESVLGVRDVDNRLRVRRPDQEAREREGRPKSPN